MAKYFWQDNKGDRVRVGLTKEAQETLGKIKFAEMPKVGTEVSVGSPFLNIEAEKAVLDLDAPLSGKIVAVNNAAGDKPLLLDSEKKEENWVVEIQA